MRTARALFVLALAACGAAKVDSKVTTRVPEQSACEEARATPTGSKVLFTVTAKRTLNMSCIGGGGWETTEGPSYEPTLKNCSKPVFQAASLAVEPSKVLRQNFKARSVLLHFRSQDPGYYEISYEWYERSGAAVLSLLKISSAGDASDPVEDFNALKRKLTDAFYCK